jgi:hypothetical protein
MNQDQFMSILRTCITAIGSVIAVYAGTQEQALWGVISGAIIAIAPIAWSMYVHSDAGKVAAVSALPEVKGITFANNDNGLADIAKRADPTTNVILLPKPKAVAA